jgi:hypothetical protein
MAGKHVLDDPNHWYNRADETRALAETIDDVETKATMLRIAADYIQLAKRAEDRGKDK